MVIVGGDYGWRCIVVVIVVSDEVNVVGDTWWW